MFLHVTLEMIKQLGALSTRLGACLTNYQWVALQRIIIGFFPPDWGYVQQMINGLICCGLSMASLGHVQYIISGLLHIGL